MMTIKLVHGAQDRWEYFSADMDMHDVVNRHADYYLAGGTPARWLGNGLPALSQRNVEINSERFKLLFEEGKNPLDVSGGTALGTPFRKTMPLEDRIEKRISEDIPRKCSTDERARLVAKITAEEEHRDVRKPVTSAEVVFNPPKSVSAVWACADAKLKTQIVEAHQAALDHAMEVLERDYARTRVGTDGAAQVAVNGVVAAAFDHIDTRNGDPQLHTHVLIANKAQGPDGKWRTLDSKNALLPGAVTVSGVYDSALRDELSSRFEIKWTIQQVSAKPEQYTAWRKSNKLADSLTTREQFALTELRLERKNLKYEIDGVPNTLIATWSTRSDQVEAFKDDKVAAYQEANDGRTPPMSLILKWRAQAALQTRKAKSGEIKALANQSAGWRDQARPLIGDAVKFAERIMTKKAPRGDAYRQDDVFRPEDIDHLTGQIALELSKSTTWRRSNALAAAHRVLAPYTFRTPGDREATAGRLVESTITAHSVQLTTRTGRRTVERFETTDGSAFEPASRDLFTTKDIWNAEQRLLTAADTPTTLTFTPLPTRELDAGEHPLSTDQRTAVEIIMRSGRALDVLVGPAGAGKTTSLAELRRQWETYQGEQSVVGLAPSAAAAKVLETELGITTENTAKWLTESTKPNPSSQWVIKAGQLVIVDEAGMSGTLALDQLRAQCEAAGAKLLLVGDHEQLSAVDAGGAFGMITRHLPDHAELDSVWRFKADWESGASIALRNGYKTGLQAYIDHDRVTHGLTDQVLDQAFTAWQQDVSAGKTSLLMATDNDQVTLLNQRAQAWRAQNGELGDTTTPIANATSARPGDLIVTRLNDRTITTGDGFVRNGSTFTVETIQGDGGMTVLDEVTHSHVFLPAEYVREHVELAYASTVHRAQGRTVDTAHSIVDASMGRGAFYVAMTRGKTMNRAYVDVTPEEVLEGATNPGIESHIQVLNRIIENSSEETSAHETSESELERLQNTMTLVNEYETLANIENSRYASSLYAANGIHLEADTTTNVLTDYLATLRAAGVDPKPLLTQAVTDLRDAGKNPTALNLRQALSATMPQTPRPPRIAGLTQEAPTTTDLDLARALQDRERALTLRAETVLDVAIAHQAQWVTDLGTAIPGRETDWHTAAVTIASYRDKWQIPGDEPIMTGIPVTERQRRDRVIAERAQKLAAKCSNPQSQTRPAATNQPLIKQRPVEVGHHTETMRPGL